MRLRFQRFVVSVFALVLVVGCLLPAIQFPASAKSYEVIPSPCDYFDNYKSTREIKSEGRIGYEFSYSSYPSTAVSKYISILEDYAFKAGSLNKIISGDRTRTVSYGGNVCVKFNFSASDDIFTVFLYTDNLKKAGFQVASANSGKSTGSAPFWVPEPFFGAASSTEYDDDQTTYTYKCSSYPESKVKEYADHLKTHQVKAGGISKKLSGNSTQKFKLDGDVLVEISWNAKSKQLEICIFDTIKTDVDEQTGATPTVYSEKCFDCGEAEGLYDGYCYYCHPDFLFLCKRCGCLWPAHRTPDGMCTPCSDAVKNGASKTIKKPKVSLDYCMECGQPGGEYDGYCYYCHPDFLFICKKCRNLCPAQRTESGLCMECEDAS